MTIHYVIDTETTTRNFYPVPDGHIVEVGVAAADLDAGTVSPIMSRLYYAVHDGTEWVFRNTTLTSRQLLYAGFYYEPNDLRFLRESNAVVHAYNIDFDRTMLRRDFPDVEPEISWGADIMLLASEVGGIPRHHEGAWPRAEDSYNQLCPDDPAGIRGRERHRALSDAEVEAHILIALHRMGIYDPEEDEREADA